MVVFSFTDIVDREADKPLIVKARLHLFATNEGGRKAPLQTGYRPNHNFGAPDDREMYIGQIDFIETTILQPGETTEVIVRFIPGRGLNAKLSVGRTWLIQEGPQFVGEATVLELFNET